MAFVSAADLNALGDATKLNFTVVSADEESSVTTEIFSQVGQVYNTVVWTDSTNTPKLIIKIIAMFYVGWHYQKVYSEDDAPNNFGLLLIARGQRLVDGIVAGVLNLPDAPTPINNEQPDFYPTDASSLMSPTVDDRSLGGPMFNMSDVF